MDFALSSLPLPVRLRSMRSPDAAFMSRARWDALPRSEQKVFGHVVPEFVIELRSESDALLELQDKMRMWVANGVELAWLIDPRRKVVEVYRADDKTEVHTIRPACKVVGRCAGLSW